MSATWIVCSSCGLRHSARPDGRCPRCGEPSAPPVEDAPGAAWRPPPPPPPVVAKEDTNRLLGMRIVGGAMILGVLLVLGSPVPRAAREAAAVYRIAVALPLLLGIALLLGSEVARKIAIGLILLGTAGIVVAAAVTHAWILLAALAYPLAQLLLLVGEPGGGRIALASLVLAAGLVLSVLARIGGGSVAAKILQWGDEIEGAPVTRVAGATWRFDVPPGQWYVSKRKFGGADSAEGRLERAVVRPEGPAMAYLFSSRVPSDRGFDLDVLTDAVSKALAQRLPSYHLHEVAPLPGRGGTRVLHFSAKIEGEDFEALCAIYPNAPMLYWLMAGAHPRVFATVRPELQELLESFRSEALPDGERPRQSEPSPVPTSS